LPGKTRSSGVDIQDPQSFSQFNTRFSHHPNSQLDESQFLNHIRSIIPDLKQTTIRENTTAATLTATTENTQNLFMPQPITTLFPLEQCIITDIPIDKPEDLFQKFSQFQTQQQSIHPLLYLFPSHILGSDALYSELFNRHQNYYNQYKVNQTDDNKQSFQDQQPQQQQQQFQDGPDQQQQFLEQQQDLDEVIEIDTDGDDVQEIEVDSDEYGDDDHQNEHGSQTYLNGNSIQSIHSLHDQQHIEAMQRTQEYLKTLQFLDNAQNFLCTYTPALDRHGHNNSNNNNNNNDDDTHNKAGGQQQQQQQVEHIQYNVSNLSTILFSIQLYLYDSKYVLYLYENGESSHDFTNARYQITKHFANPKQQQFIYNLQLPSFSSLSLPLTFALEQQQSQQSQQQEQQSQQQKPGEKLSQLEPDDEALFLQNLAKHFADADTTPTSATFPDPQTGEFDGQDLMDPNAIPLDKVQKQTLSLKAQQEVTNQDDNTNNKVCEDIFNPQIATTQTTTIISQNQQTENSLQQLHTASSKIKYAPAVFTPGQTFNTLQTQHELLLARYEYQQKVDLWRKQHQPSGFLPQQQQSTEVTIEGLKCQTLLPNHPHYMAPIPVHIRPPQLPLSAGPYIRALETPMQQLAASLFKIDSSTKDFIATLLKLNIDVIPCHQYPLLPNGIHKSAPFLQRKLSKAEVYTVELFLQQLNLFTPIGLYIPESPTTATTTATQPTTTTTTTDDDYSYIKQLRTQNEQLQQEIGILQSQRQNELVVISELPDAQFEQYQHGPVYVNGKFESIIAPIKLNVPDPTHPVTGLTYFNALSSSPSFLTRHYLLQTYLFSFYNNYFFREIIRVKIEQLNQSAETVQADDIAHLQQISDVSFQSDLAAINRLKLVDLQSKQFTPLNDQAFIAAKLAVDIELIESMAQDLSKSTTHQQLPRKLQL
jgi:hypothetical protein